MSLYDSRLGLPPSKQELKGVMHKIKPFGVQEYGLSQEKRNSVPQLPEKVSSIVSHYSGGSDVGNIHVYIPIP